MNKKFLITFIVTLIYVAAFLSFIYFSKRPYGCSFNSRCVRFCSSDTNKISDDSLLEKFKESHSVHKMWRINNDLRVIRGAPLCGKMKFWPPNQKINSTDPSYSFDFYGDVVVGGDEYSVSRYCFEKAEDVNDGWKLMICYQDLYLQKGFHILSLFLPVCLLGFTLFVYLYFKELRDFHGKVIIALTGSQILAMILVPFIRYLYDRNDFRQILYIIISLFVLSLVMTLLWITVLIIHTFLTFRNFKNSISTSYEFSTYGIIVVSFGMFSAFVFKQQLTTIGGGIEFLVFTYFCIAIVDIILLIITGVKIFMISRHLEHSEQAKFSNEKKWYWIIVKISLMMLVTWPFEIFLMQELDMLKETTGDFVNLLTTTAIVLMLVGREKARILLFGKYRDIQNDAD